MASLGRALVRSSDGREVWLEPGGLIGRLRAAALQLNHPDVSEVHAYVSLRAGRLMLLPLRGGLGVFGVVVREVELSPGLKVQLAPNAELTVLQVQLPGEVPVLEIDGIPHPLGDGVSWFLEGTVAVWSDGGDYFAQVDGRIALLAAPLTVGPHTLELCWQSLDQASVPTTQGGGTRLPLKVVARFDSARIVRPGRPEVRLAGVPARVLSVLAEFDGPVHWEVAAKEVWPAHADRIQLRQRWDRALSVLRAKLKEHAVRPDLLQSSAGQIELVLGPQDERDVAT